MGFFQRLQLKLIFLCETRQNKDRVRDRLRNRLGLSGFAGVDSAGTSGELALFWHEQFDVTVISLNKNFIDV